MSARQTATARPAERMILDPTDLAMARVAVEYYRRAHLLSKREIPPAADRLAAHLASAMAVDGHDSKTSASRWLTTRQIAKRLGCSQRHARRIAERHGTRIGRQWLTREEDI